MISTKIEKVHIEPFYIELAEPFTIAIGKKQRIENAIITLVLESGVEGYGEAAPLESINGENQATVLAVLQSCKDFLIGKSAADYRRISHQLEDMFWPQAAARCAIEMALLDAFAKTLGLPLYQFFGGMESEIETDYTIDIVSSDEAKRKAAQFAKRGYRTLKVKVGKNVREDIKRVLAVKEGAPDCQISLDANQGFTPCEAVSFVEQALKNDVAPILFEQPVVKHDLTGMKFVKDHTSVPIVADETVFTRSDAIAVIRSGCADVINIKTMKSGILGALDIAAVARSADIDLMIGCMLESVLSKSASVHLAAGLGGFRFVDLDPHLYPEKDPFAGGPQFRDPIYRLADEHPGIGVFRK